MYKVTLRDIKTSVRISVDIHWQKEIHIAKACLNNTVFWRYMKGGGDDSCQSFTGRKFHRAGVTETQGHGGPREAPHCRMPVIKVEHNAEAGLSACCGCEQGLFRRNPTLVFLLRPQAPPFRDRYSGWRREGSTS